MKTAYQLWGVAPKDAPWDELCTRFDDMQRRHPCDIAIVGLDAPRQTYARLRKSAKQMYLWLPVFSEWDHLTDYDPLIDCDGKDFLAGHTGAFHFRCPSSEKNIEAMLQESLLRLDMGQFDGVFLDRIRYPSFQYGLSGVLGCFCDGCVRRLREMGLDAGALRRACQRVREDRPNPLGLISFDGRRWAVEDPDLQALFDARCAILTESLRRICQFFAERGLKIGLDLFTPALGYFTGQDVGLLAPMADFVKPMLYLRTDAPAGLPYEIRMMDEAAGNRNPLLALLGANNLKTFVKGEVERMAQLKTDVLCGFEYNRVLPIAPTTPQIIREDVRWLLSCGADGVTACWNLFSTPEEHVDALFETLA